MTSSGSDFSGIKIPDHNSVTYSSYLKVSELIGLQKLLSDPPEHDEMLFIVIHQVYELWFKQILHEIDRSEMSLQSGSVFDALKGLKRIAAIQKVLTEQVSILETMTPNDFNRFRERLNPASGFQSWQFRIVEFRMGLKDTAYLKFFRAMPDIAELLNKTLKQHSFYWHVLSFLSQKGYAVPQECLSKDPALPYEPSQGVEDLFASIYQDHFKHAEAYYLLESLIDLDQLFSLWRFRHVAMVERMIGGLVGTGGSSGAHYLRSTLPKRFFPEIWSVRNQLGTSVYGGQKAP